MVKLTGWDVWLDLAVGFVSDKIHGSNHVKPFSLSRQFLIIAQVATLTAATPATCAANYIAANGNWRIWVVSPGMMSILGEAVVTAKRIWGTSGSCTT